MNISTHDLCRQHLFTAQEDIIAQFGEAAAERVMRVRDMYMWRLANPDAKDRQFVDEFKSRYPMCKNAAQEYLLIVHALLPELSEKSRDFHRWRYNEIIMETYQMAKARKVVIDLPFNTSCPISRISMRLFSASRSLEVSIERLSSAMVSPWLSVMSSCLTLVM